MSPSTEISKRRVFVIRPWNNPKASLYPHTMDGVEYIGAVLKTIKSTFGTDNFDVRIDEDVFIPGLTLRQNLERELVNAEVVLAILDGLRPNVVYELGFAFGLREAADIGPDDQPEPRIVCLAERHATVLVRNYYPDPMSVPTTEGEKVRILNPALNICSSFSDNADLLILTYDRLDLDSSLAARLRKLIQDIQREESKQDIASQAAGTELRPTVEAIKSSEVTSAKPGTPSGAESPESKSGLSAGTKIDVNETQRLWDLYERGSYVEVIDATSPPKNPEQRKVLALSLMKLGRIYEAMQTWRESLSEGTSVAAALFHLGVCYYVIRDYEKSAYFFDEAEKEEGQSPRIGMWKKRLETKMRFSSHRTARSSSPKPEEAS